MLDYIKTLWPLIEPIAAGQVRHGLTVVAGGLITKGALESGQEGAFVQIGSGLATWAAVAAWSWWQKSGQNKLIAFAARMPKLVNQAAPTSVAVDAVKVAAADPANAPALK
jgi:hypothetical protein